MQQRVSQHLVEAQSCQTEIGQTAKFNIAGRNLINLTYAKLCPIIDLLSASRWKDFYHILQRFGEYPFGIFSFRPFLAAPNIAQKRQAA